MAHFNSPSIHSVDTVRAEFSHEHGCVTLTFDGVASHVTDAPLELNVFFNETADALAFAERFANAINRAHDIVAVEIEPVAHAAELHPVPVP